MKDYTPTGTAPQAAIDESVRVAEEFCNRLTTLATEYMKSRCSKVLTDTEVQKAYRDLIIRPHISKLHRGIGDFMLVLGGAAVSAGLTSLSSLGPLWSIAFTILGVAFVMAGVYVREFTMAN